MSIIRFLISIYLLFSVSNVYSDDYPLIYISPNPNKINIDMHASNVEVISLDKNDVNFSITDILRNNTNLAFSQSGGISSTNQLRMRGGEANHVLALIDGIDVNDPASGAEYDFGQLFSYNINSVEVLNGAFSHVHGPDAVSGVINIKTRNTNAFNFAVGSNNTNIRNYSMAGENGKYQYGIDINSLSSSGTDDSGSSGGRNRYESDNIRINIKSIEHDFTVLYFDTYRQNDVDANNSLADSEYAHTDINQIYSKYSFQKNINKYIFSKNEIQYSTNKNNDFAPVTGLWKTLTQSEKFKLKSNTSIQLKELFKTKYEPTLSLGFEYKKLNFTQLVKDKRFGDGDQMQGEYNSSYSAEFIYPLENLQFELGVRRTLNQKFDNQNTHRFGISYKQKNKKIFFNHSSAFKNPTFTERFGYYTSFKGNPNLKPENVIQYEIGYKVNAFLNKFDISQTFYNSKLSNEINGSASHPEGGFTANNMDSNSYRKGLETRINYNINRYSDASISYDYVDSTQYNSSTENQQAEVRRPRNLININYNNNFFNNLSINSNIFYSSKVKDTDFSSYPFQNVYMNSYFLFNTTLNYDVDSKNKVSLIFKNIFNREYNVVNDFNTPGFEVLINYRNNF
ncbi:MAG: TonB-dependent receptor plug domain-containing protein [Gammaproteobacteria bacterium]